MKTNVLEMTETKQYLTFTLAGDLFAVDVARVREILEFIPVTKIPGAEDVLRGVINVRGSVVPVMDMRKKFGFLHREDTIETCIVVLEVETNDQAVIFGAVVDAVQEVLDLPGNEVQAAPSMGSMIDSSFIEGIGRRGQAFVIILDVDQMFSATEISPARTDAEDFES